MGGGNLNAILFVEFKQLPVSRAMPARLNRQTKITPASRFLTWVGFIHNRLTYLGSNKRREFRVMKFVERNTQIKWVLLLVFTNVKE